MTCWLSEAAVAEPPADRAEVAAGARARAERPGGAAEGCMARYGFVMWARP